MRGVDGLLVTVLLCVPLLMGGRQALGQMTLVVLALAAGVCWCLHQALTRQSGWIWSSAELLLFGMAALVGFQLIPLPPAVIQTLSPRVYEILPTWSPDAAPSARLGVWSCLSLTPAETRGSLLLLAAYAILFLVTVQRIRETKDVERLLRWVAIAGIGMAAFGLIQYLTNNGKYFWFYEHPWADTATVATGSFTNRNHFAHFLVLALGPLIWWIESHAKPLAKRPGRQPHTDHFARPAGANAGFLAAALGLCVLAVLLSLSRGGSAVMFLAAAACLLMLYRASLLDGKTILCLLGTGLLVVGSLGIYGYHLVSARLNDFESISELDRLNQRRGVWQAGLAAAADYRWLGAGAGSHVQVVPMYLPDNQVTQHFKYTHAENGYLQIAVELGVAGLLLLLAAIGLVGYWCLAVLAPGISQRELLCFAGILPGFVASLVHSLVDFVWYVPGCMVVVVLLAACACRLSQLVRQDTKPLVVPVPRAAWLMAAPLLLLVGGLATPGLFGAVLAEPKWHRASAQLETLAERDVPEEGDELGSIVADLNDVVAWQPDHALAHAMLTDAHLRLFEQAQGAGGLDARQVRDAAVASKFASRAALDGWMSKAFGSSPQHLDVALKHARQAARLCPLHGAIYVRLAALLFLEGPRAPSKEHCLQQAVLLRPYDGSLLFEVGQEFAIAGDSETAYAYWIKSFQCGSRHQHRLIGILASQLPARAFLETFPIDLPSLRLLEAEYRRRKQTDDLKEILAVHARAASHEATQMADASSVKTWMEAARAYRELGDTDGCVASLRQALRWDSSLYDAHYLLGTCLFQAKHYAEAEEHLAWCRQRKQHDANLRSMLETILSERLGTNRPRL